MQHKEIYSAAKYFIIFWEGITVLILSHKHIFVFFLKYYTKSVIKTFSILALWDNCLACHKLVLNFYN
jgi:hypothetical protein